jgi:PAS domain S-box-containing protein
MGLQICESNLNYLLELRLENNPEMNAALRKEAVEEVKGISRHFQKVHMLVVEDNRRILGASVNLEKAGFDFPTFDRKRTDIATQDLWGNTVRMHSLYFPFWNWQIVSFIDERDYQSPVYMGKKIVYLGTFGVLSTVCLTLFVVLNFFVNQPLKKVIKATKGIAQGNFRKLDFNRNDEIGQVVYAFNSMVDSLNSKAREVSNLIGALSESEQRYRILFESAVEGILVTEIKTKKFKYANPALCEILGYSEKEFAQMTLFDIHPKDKLEFAVSQFETMAKGGKILTSDVPCCRKDGTIIYADVKGTKIVVDQTECILGHFTDITLRKLAEDENKKLQLRLQRAEKMEALGVLAGGVAHDLNNVLCGLVSYPEFLLLDLPEDSPLRVPILTIESSGKKAAAIVQDLLTLARRGVAVTEVTNLNDVISEYLGSLEFEKLKKFHPNTEIDINLDEDLFNITGSPVHLSKTVMNLVSNAAEASPDGGHISISTKNQYVDQVISGYEDVMEGDYVVLTVADQGIGISSEDKEKIFEPFYSKKVMGRSGTGLGMAVVWGSVKDHKGYINVVSEVGKGTKFILYFPVTREETEKYDADISIEKLLGKGEEILVIDDVQEQRDIASMLLTKLGYSVTTVSSGEKAVEYMKTGSADLLILDMIMDPGIDGLQTYKNILELHSGQKAIIASGFSETDRVKEAHKLGAGQYVRKPYALKQLGIAVRTELRKQSFQTPSANHPEIDHQSS